MIGFGYMNQYINVNGWLIDSSSPFIPIFYYLCLQSRSFSSFSNLYSKSSSVFLDLFLSLMSSNFLSFLPVHYYPIFAYTQTFLNNFFSFFLNICNSLTIPYIFVYSSFKVDLRIHQQFTSQLWNVERSHVPRSGNVRPQSPQNTTQIAQGDVLVQKTFLKTYFGLHLHFKEKRREENKMKPRKLIS